MCGHDDTPATTHLRKLLTRHDADWTAASETETWWETDDGTHWSAEENGDGECLCHVEAITCLTPEQAVELTLGATECTYDQWRAISDAIAAAMEYAHDKAMEHPDHADPLWNLDEYVNRVIAVMFEGARPKGPDTCSLTKRSWDDGTCTWGVECSACHARFEHESGTTWRFCPSCGRPTDHAHLS